jgi:hypothetical protein
MTWIKNHKITRSQWLALILAITALSIWIYSLIELKSNEIMLTNQNLNIEEIWRYEGALQWWKNTYVTTIIPITAILSILSAATLLHQKILSPFTKEPILNKFEETLKKACKIDQD